MATRSKTPRDPFVDSLKEYLKPVTASRSVHVEVEADRLVVQGDGPLLHFYNLGAARSRWNEAKEHQRRRVLDKFLSALRRPPEEVSKDMVAERLLPKLRSRNDLAALELRKTVIEQIDGKSALDMVPAATPLNEELAAQLVFELTEEASDVGADRPRAWGVPFEELLAIGTENLRARTPNELPRLAPKLFGLVQNDGLEASRLLLPELFDGVKVKGEVIAMVPSRDVLLVSGSEHDDALGRMAQVAVEAVQSPLGVSGFAFVRRGAEWHPWLPPDDHPLFEAFRVARLPAAVRTYTQFRQLTDAAREKDPTVVGVAQYALVQNEQGRPVSVSVWPHDAELLLPRAENIGLATPDPKDESNTLIQVMPWDHVASLPGVKLTQKSKYPELWLAEGFPPKTLTTPS